LSTYTQPEKCFFFMALSIVQLLVAAKVVFKVLKVGFGVDVLFEETITKHADVKYGLPLDSRSESGKGSNDAHLVFDRSKPLHPDTGVYDDTSDPKKLGEGTHDSLGRVGVGETLKV
jgi:hypothetical protein